jgi:ribulose kinase
MVAATAAGLFNDLPGACSAMAQAGTIRLPDPAAMAQFDRDYRTQLAMQRHRAEIDAIARG